MLTMRASGMGPFLPEPTAAHGPRNPHPGPDDSLAGVSRRNLMQARTCIRSSGVVHETQGRGGLAWIVPAAHMVRVRVRRGSARCGGMRQVERNSAVWGGACRGAE